MTLNILVSFSLLALVVTARPISNASQSVKRSLQVQNAVQAILASRTGRIPDCLGCEDEDAVHVALTSSEEQSAFLSGLDNLDAIKAIIPLNVDEAASDDEKQLYEILKNLKSTDSLNDVDGNHPTSTSLASHSELHDEELPVTIAELYTSPPVIVLAVSCIAALLAVFCVGAGLYAYNHINAIMIKSGLAWDVLPRLERHVGIDISHDHYDGGSTSLPGKGKLLTNAPLPPINVIQETLDEKSKGVMLGDIDKPLLDEEELDEKFHDAPEPSLLFNDSAQYQAKPDIPPIVIEGHPDPDLLPLPDISSGRSTLFSTPLRTPLRTLLSSPTRSPSPSSPQMREMQASPTLSSSKPLWSIRAADAPTLGLTGVSPSPSYASSRSDSPVPQLPGALYADDAPEMMSQPPRQRTPREPLDIAFALQLRPGLGLGSDPAWLVRFLMTMFGWMTFFMRGGPGREDARRALTA